MHWPREARTRVAERDEREALDRYMRCRGARVSEKWLATVEEARRWADARTRLERLLQAMR
ncbi:MAG: hypothetical protein WCB85_05955 [Candidatus Dormiibacterota bacterium]